LDIFYVIATSGAWSFALEKRGDIMAWKMSSYIYSTVFVRNAENLTQLLLKGLKT
jgi:hypothetical protein